MTFQDLQNGDLFTYAGTDTVWIKRGPRWAATATQTRPVGNHNVNPFAPVIKQ